MGRGRGESNLHPQRPWPESFMDRRVVPLEKTGENILEKETMGARNGRNESLASQEISCHRVRGPGAVEAPCQAVLWDPSRGGSTQAGAEGKPGSQHT